MIYTTRKAAAIANLRAGVFFLGGPRGIPHYMARKATYIRHWRKSLGFTLEQMVGRLAEIGVDTTAASLSRIERGQQPYSQDILEAIAEALDRSVADLIENNPDIPEAQIFDLMSRLDDGEKRQAESVLRAMFGERA